MPIFDDIPTWLSKILNCQNYMNEPRLLEQSDLQERFDYWHLKILTSNFVGDECIRPILTLREDRGFGLYDAPIYHMNVYSSAIYPKYFVGKKGQALIWDSHFWDLYSFFFLFAFDILEYGHIYRVKPKIELENDLCKTGKLLTSMMMLILSHRFESDPNMSLLLAKKYSEQYPQFLKYDSAKTGFSLKQTPNSVVNSAEDIIENMGVCWHLKIVKQFVYCHEIIHMKMRVQGSERYLAYEQTLSFCNLLLELEKSNVAAHNKISSTFGSEKEQHIFLGLLEDIINRKNDSFLEELYCDAFSIMLVYEELAEASKDKQRIFFELSTLGYLSMFLQWINNTELRWKKIHTFLINDNNGMFVSLDVLSTDLLQTNMEIGMRVMLSWAFAGAMIEDKYGVEGVGALCRIKSELLSQFHPLLSEVSHGKLNVDIFGEYIPLKKEKNSIAELKKMRDKYIGWTDLRGVKI